MYVESVCVCMCAYVYVCACVLFDICCIDATVEREAHQDAKSPFSKEAEGFSLLGKD